MLTYLLTHTCADVTYSFLGAIKRIVADGYVPTVQDILHARLTTTGVIETTFTFKGYNFRCAL